MTQQSIACFSEIPVSQLVSETGEGDALSALPDRNFQTLLISIQYNGIRCPLLVCRTRGDSYRIIDGRRRFEAALRLGVPTVPCMILDEVSDDEMNAIWLDLELTRRTMTDDDLEEYATRSGAAHRAANGA